MLKHCCEDRFLTSSTKSTRCAKPARVDWSFNLPQSIASSRSFDVTSASISALRAERRNRDRMPSNEDLRLVNSEWLLREPVIACSDETSSISFDEGVAIQGQALEERLEMLGEQPDSNQSEDDLLRCAGKKPSARSINGACRASMLALFMWIIRNPAASNASRRLFGVGVPMAPMSGLIFCMSDACFGSSGS